MAVHIIEFAGPPSAAPSARGQHWIDTLNGDEYFSVGTATVADWILRGSGSGGGGWPATREYLSVTYNGDFTANSQGYTLLSQDGGLNWNISGPPESAAPGAVDRLVPRTGFHRWENEAIGIGKLMFIGSSSEYPFAGPPALNYIRVTNDKGATWQQIRATAITATSGHSIPNLDAGPYSYSFYAPAWDGALTYAVLTHDTGADDYIEASTDGGGTWAPVVITGTLLTDLETAGWHPCNRGFWYDSGQWWAATFDSNTLTTINIHTSATLAGPWAIHGTILLGIGITDWGWGGAYGGAVGGIPAGGVGVVTAPTLGSFIFVENSFVGSTEIWRIAPGPGPLTQVVADSSVIVTGSPLYTGQVLSGGVTQCPWVKGVIDPGGAGEKVFCAMVNPDGAAVNQYNQQFVVSTTDGTTWDANMHISIHEDYNISVKGAQGNWGWDGYGWIWGTDDGSGDRAAMGFVGENTVSQPHRSMILLSGQSPGSHIIDAEAEISTSVVIIDP